MIHEHYGRYIRGDGDALLRAYLAKPKPAKKKQRTGTLTETFSPGMTNYRNERVRPTGIEPESPKTADEPEEPDVIDISKLKKAGE